MSLSVNICIYESNEGKRFKRQKHIVLNDMKTKVRTLSQMVSKVFELNEDNFGQFSSFLINR